MLAVNMTANATAMGSFGSVPPGWSCFNARVVRLLHLLPFYHPHRPPILKNKCIAPGADGNKPLIYIAKRHGVGQHP